MSLTASAIRLMASKGMTAEDIAEIAEAMEKPVAVVTPGAIRTRRWRENKAADITESVTVTHHRDVTHVGEPAQVVKPSSSLRSEGNPPEKATPSTPKGANSARGTRLPDDWSPPASLIAGDFGLTHEQYAQQADVFRDYWRAVPGAKGRKSDWPATWRNWLRRTAENATRKAPHERPDADPKFTARQANYARAFAGAEQASRQRWEP